MTEISKMPLSELSKKIKLGEINASETVKSYEQNINKHSDLGAFISVDINSALEHAESIDKKIESDQFTSALAGIPYGAKDNFATTEFKTTCGSKMLENYRSPFESSVTAKLLNDDAILVGKLNMDEFAMGSTGLNSYFGMMKNPHAVDRIPGGSSGGSAIAVATNQVAFALGTDTGGSTRQPAAYCGVVGLKPSYGRISRYGVVALASSLDHVGIFAKTVEDSAIVLSEISGKDSLDENTINQKLSDLFLELNKDISGIKVGYRQVGHEIDSDVKLAINNIINKISNEKAIVQEFSVVNEEIVPFVYYVLCTAEGFSSLGRFDGIGFGHRASSFENVEDLISKSRGEGFGEEVKKRLLMGVNSLNGENLNKYYFAAQKARMQISNEYDKHFEKYDVIISPTTSGVAPEISKECTAEQTMQAYKLTAVENLLGLPSISVPIGINGDGMPIGMMITANKNREDLVLRVAKNIEQLANYKAINSF